MTADARPRHGNLCHPPTTLGLDRTLEWHVLSFLSVCLVPPSVLSPQHRTFWCAQNPLHCNFIHSSRVTVVARLPLRSRPLYLVGLGLGLGSNDRYAVSQPGPGPTG